MRIPTAGDRVAAGVSFLNNHPLAIGWREKVDADAHDVSCGGCSILGQLTGNFYRGLKKFDLTLRQAALLGFTPLELRLNHYSGEVRALNEEWKLALSLSVDSRAVESVESEVMEA